MGNEDLIVPKIECPVVLWVHPEGRVAGSLFLREGETEVPEERVIDVLNHDQPFVVLKRSDPEEVRFYHRSSILRAEYAARRPADTSGMILHRCQVGIMDGSLIEATLIRPAPPDRSRLFDFLNRDRERFLEVFSDEGETLALNKSYVIFVRPLSGGVAGGGSADEAGVEET